MGLGSLCVALIAGSVVMSVVPQWVVWYVQADRSTRNVSGDLIHEIASKVMTALEMTISEAEHITAELVNLAESSPYACSDDPNASGTAVVGKWRDLYNLVRMPSRAGWAIIGGDRHGSMVCIFGTPPELQLKPAPRDPLYVNTVNINRVEGTIEVGKLLSTTKNLNVSARPWYADAARNAGGLTWGRFFIGIPAGRQLIAVSHTYGSLQQPNRTCGATGVLMGVGGWQQFLRQQHVGKTGDVWLIEADTQLLFSTTRNASLFIGKTAQRVLAWNSTDERTRSIGKYVAKMTAGGRMPRPGVETVDIGGKSCQVLVSRVDIHPGTAFAPMLYVVAIPVDDYWGAISKGIAITIAITVVLFVLSLAVSIIAGLVIVSRPLARTSKTISRLSCLRMEDLAYVSGHPLPPRRETVAASKSEMDVSRSGATANVEDENEGISRFRDTHVLSEIKDLLVSASKMAESLYAVGRYVSMDLCSWVIENRVVGMPLSPKVITVIFCDIQGSTAMIDKSKREGTMIEFGSMLNEILTTLANVARRHGGYIDKLIGDEVMVIFNAPYDCKDHQLHACLAALRMRTAVAELCRSWDELGLYKLFLRPRVRIGVAAGEALIGDIGAFGTLTNFTAIGDTVCIASRLQTAAKVIDPEGTGTLVTGDTWPLLVCTIVGKRSKCDDAELEAMAMFDSAMQSFYHSEWEECVEKLRAIGHSSTAVVKDAEVIIRLAENNMEPAAASTDVVVKVGTRYGVFPAAEGRMAGLVESSVSERFAMPLSAFVLLLPGGDDLRPYGTGELVGGRHVLDSKAILDAQFFHILQGLGCDKTLLAHTYSEAVACGGDSAGAILEYLVPPAELDLLPNVQSREDALGLSFAVFNDRLQRSILCADTSRQDTQLAVYGTPGSGKTRFLEELAKATPALVASCIAHARDHLSADERKAAGGEFEVTAELMGMVAQWVAVAVTYNAGTKFHPAIDRQPSRGLALRMLLAHFFVQSGAPNPLAKVAEMFPMVEDPVQAAGAIVRDHWQRDTVTSEQGRMALFLAVDEVVMADGPAADEGARSNAREVVHQVGRLQDAFVRQTTPDGKQRQAIVFSAVSTLDKVAVGPTTPGSGRQIVYAPLRSLSRPAAAANGRVQALVREHEEYRALFHECGRLPRGALYCAEVVLGRGGHPEPIGVLERDLLRRLQRSPFLLDGRTFVVLATHALCSHALQRARPVPGLGGATTLADLVAPAAFDGVEQMRCPGALMAVMDTYVPYMTPLRLLQAACYDPNASVPQREVKTAADLSAYVEQKRAEEASVYLGSELIIGLRGGKTGERFTDGHEFERLVAMRLAPCPSLRLELRLTAEGMGPDETLAALLGGAEALCNERTREWLEGTTLLCEQRRVVVSIGTHMPTFLRELHALGDSEAGGRSMAQLLDDVVVYAEPGANLPGIDLALFAKAKSTATVEQPLRIGMGVEARCSKVKLKAAKSPAKAAASGTEEERAAARPELSLNADILAEHAKALRQMGLAPIAKRTKTSRSAPGAVGPPLKRSRGHEGKAFTTTKDDKAETDISEYEEEEEEEGLVYEAAPAASREEFVPEQWAINAANGFDRFLFVVMSNRARRG
eukprot:m51a1_g12324 hypothetical protein (1600) ;mRNA; r:438494-444645